MGDLDKRVRRLERTNRALIVGIGLAFLMAARPSGDGKFETITAKKLVIQDEKGTPRIVTETDGENVQLVFTDEPGRKLLNMGVIEKKPYLELTGHYGTGHISMSVEDEGAAISLLNSRLKTRAALEFQKDQPSITLFGKDQKILFSKP